MREEKRWLRHFKWTQPFFSFGCKIYYATRGQRPDKTPFRSTKGEGQQLQKHL